MANVSGSRIGVIIISLLISFAAAREYVPVLLVGSLESASNGVGVTALSKLTADEFRKYLLKLVDSSQEVSNPPLILVFAEESLSVEDFSWANVGDYGSYPRLMNITRSSNSIFLPAVHQPLKALEGLRDSGFKWIKYTPTQVFMAISAGDDKVVPKVNQDTKGVVVYIDMEDANPSEDRPDMLRRHDTFLVDTYEKLKDDREVIVVYAADHSSWYDTEGEESSANMSESEDDDYIREIRSSTRRLLAEPDETNEEKVLYSGNNVILLYSDKFPILYNSSDTPWMVLNGTPQVTVDRRQQGQRLQLKYPALYVRLVFFFEVSKSWYWTLTNLELSLGSPHGSNFTTVLKPSRKIEAPTGFSYHCGQNVEFINDTIKVVYEGLQVQAYRKGDHIGFSDAYDCVYFFTAAIWSGLFVTVLLGLILTWGLSMIMSIRTMDRFDDPKGKTITIGGAE